MTSRPNNTGGDIYSVNETTAGHSNMSNSSSSFNSNHVLFKLSTQLNNTSSVVDVDSHHNIIPSDYDDSDLERAISLSLAESGTQSSAAYRIDLFQSLLLLQYNKRLFRVDGYGDCQFMALSHQLYGSTIHHLVIRQQCCDYIERYPEQFILEDRDLNFSTYISQMRRPACERGSSYGDEHTLHAF